MLNRDWRGKDKATDVLSFPQLEPKQLLALGRSARKTKVPQWWLGDVVISVETAKAQAKERGHSLTDELETLLTHGLLHLLGYDHEISPREARKMRSLESKLTGRSMIG